MDVETGALAALASNVRVIERNNGALAAMVAQAGAAEPRELRLLLQDTGALASTSVIALFCVLRGELLRRDDLLKQLPKA